MPTGSESGFGSADTARWRQRPDGSNWGDFGPDDQVGRMNLITPERRLAGAREIRAGRAFCLSLPLDYPGGTALTGLRAPPRRIAAMFGDQPAYNMVWPAPDGVDRDVVCDDAVLLFTRYSTQWDALSHWGQLYDGIGDGVARKTYYNGYRKWE